MPSSLAGGWHRTGDLIAPSTTASPAAASAGAAPSSRSTSPLAQWWLPLDDADLNLLQGLALSHNHDLAIAQANLRAAQAARSAIEASAGPNLSLGWGSARNQVGSVRSESHKLSLTASWEPDLNGAQAAGLLAAEADKQAAAANLQATRVSLVAEVGIAYVQWRDAQARGHLQERALRSLQETLALTEWRNQAGLDSALALQQARLAVAQSAAQMPALATEAAQLEHQLALLTGQNLPKLLAQLAPRAEVPADAAALRQLDIGLPIDLLRRRPDLRAAEASLTAQWARDDQSRRGTWPGVTLGGTLGAQALSLANLGSAAGLANLAVSLSGPLWDGGQRRAQVAQQDALLDQARLRYEAAVASALKDVEDALTSLRASRDQCHALAQAAQAAQQVFVLTQQRRAAGLLSLSDLLEAQRNAFSAELALNNARSSQTLNLMRLYKALGGGWDAPSASASSPAESARRTPAAAKTLAPG